MKETGVLSKEERWVSFQGTETTSGFDLLPIRSQVPHDVHGLDRSVDHMIVFNKFF